MAYFRQCLAIFFLDYAKHVIPVTSGITGNLCLNYLPIGAREHVLQVGVDRRQKVNDRIVLISELELLYGPNQFDSL